MLAKQTLKKAQLLAANQQAQVIGAIRSALSVVDPNAHPLTVEAALVSRTLTKQLWEILPDEHFSYRFGTIDELENSGKRLFKDHFDVPVTLHLGWDTLAFSTTLRAAWETMASYYKIDTIDTYNTCIYPNSLNWYVVRAGTHLYPMDCLSGETGRLIDLENDSFRFED